MTTVVVPERGYADLARADWTALAASPEFWRLVEGKVLKASVQAGGKVRLEGSSFVGRAKCGDVVLECREKVSGALMALLYATSPTLKTHRVTSPVTELGQTASLIARLFVEEVRDYVSIGREWRYVKERAVSSLIGGSLDVPRTARLHARGLRHLAAFDRNVISYVTPTNRLLFAGLREVEALSAIISVPSRVLADARALAQFFEDCRDPELLFSPSEQLAAQVSDVLDSDQCPKRARTALGLAGILLAHNSLEPGAYLAGDAPFSWFVSLETQFERAVRQSLKRELGRRARVYKPSTSANYVFPEVAQLAAKPDLVVDRAGVAWIGDVKYKDWNTAGDPSDLYQLLTHASAFDSSTAFLVYPSDRFEAVSLGRSTSGVETWMFSIDVRDLSSGMRALVAQLDRRGVAEDELQAIEGNASGSYEVELVDGDVVTINMPQGSLLSLTGGGLQGVVSIDACQVGLPMALTFEDSEGTLAPWFGSEVRAIRSLPGDTEQG